MTQEDYWFLNIAALTLPTIVVIAQYISKRNTAELLESIKSDYIQKNAHLQTELDISKDRSSKNYSESQKALIRFYGDATKLYYYLIGNHYVDADTTLSTKIATFNKDLYGLINEFNLSFSLLQLLFEDDKTNALAEKLHTELTNLKNALSVYLHDMSESINRQNVAKSELTTLQEILKTEAEAMKQAEVDRDKEKVEEVIKNLMNGQANIERLIAELENERKNVVDSKQRLDDCRAALTPSIEEIKLDFLNYTRQCLHK